MIYSARAAVSMGRAVNTFPLLSSCFRAQLRYRDRFTITLRLPETLAAYVKEGEFWQSTVLSISAKHFSSNARSNFTTFR